MSSRNDRFECRWRSSRWLFAAYCLVQLLAICSSLTLQLPPPLGLGLLIGCLVHGAWALPRHVLLTHANAITGLRRSPDGWALFSRAKGWQPVQMRHDSMALPGVIIFRYSLPGHRRPRSACIPADSMGCETHRRLRLRLKFSPKRFAAPF